MKKQTLLFLLTFLTAAVLSGADTVLISGGTRFIKRGTAAEITIDGGTFTLRSGNSGKKSRRSIRAGNLLKNNKVSGVFTLKFDAKIENIVPGDTKDAWAGASLLLHGHKNKKYCNIYSRRITQNESGFKTWTVRSAIANDLDDLYVEFILQRASGTVTIKNITMTVAGQEDAALKPIRTRVVGGMTVELFPGKRHKQSAVPLKMPGKDLIFFDGSNTRTIYDSTIPCPGMLLKKIDVFSIPGENKRFYCGIHALKDLTLNTMTISDLSDGKGNLIPRKNILVNRVHNWPQGDGMGRELVYSVIPEVLLPVTGAKLPANTSGNFFFKVSVPENTPAGIYRGKITAETSAGKRELDLALKILPVKLLVPAKDRMCYLLHVGDFGETIADAEETCCEMKANGGNALLIACQYGKGMLQLKKGPDGKIAIRSFYKLDQALAGYRKSGMTGPFIVHFSDQLEIAVARAMKLPLPPGHESGGVNDSMNSPEFLTAMQDFFKLLKERCKGVDLYVMCIDEPGAYTSRQTRALWECRQIKKAGLKSAVYIHGEFWKELAPVCDLFLFTRNPVPGQTRDQVAEAVLKAGKLPYAYGLHGSYEGGAGGVMPNRSRSGYFAYLDKFRGQTFWIYSGRTLTDFNGTKQLSFFPRLKYRGMDNKTYSTLQYEGLFDGIQDFNYMYTVEQLLEQKASHPAAKKIRKDFLDLQKNLQAQISPSSLEEEIVGLFTNSAADTVRFRLAKWIQELQNL